MTPEQITQGIQNPKTKADVLHDYDMAKAALAKADTHELFRLYEKTVEHRTALIAAIGVLAESRDSNAPRFRPDDNSIAAIKEVALAAIEFASQAVAQQNKKAEQQEKTK